MPGLGGERHRNGAGIATDPTLTRAWTPKGVLGAWRVTFGRPGGKPSALSPSARAGAGTCWWPGMTRMPVPCHLAVRVRFAGLVASSGAATARGHHGSIGSQVCCSGLSSGWHCAVSTVWFRIALAGVSGSIPRPCAAAFPPRLPLQFPQFRIGWRSIVESVFAFDKWKMRSCSESCQAGKGRVIHTARIGLWTRVDKSTARRGGSSWARDQPLRSRLASRRRRPIYVDRAAPKGADAGH